MKKPTQFIHAYTYSKSGGQKGDYKISGCIGEAFRDEGFTSHLAKPDKGKIKVVYGSREAVEAAIQNYQNKHKDSRGHRLRKDGKSLLAGVFSWPPGTSKKKFLTDLVIVLSWLKNEYGSGLRCVISHEDEIFTDVKDHEGETHCHIHFFVVPEPGQKMSLYHEGLKAKERSRAEGENIYAQDAKYKWAMGDWQERINREVGKKLGLEKAKPKKLQEKRLSRREYKIIQSAKEKAKKIKASADAVYKKAEAALSEAKQQAKKNSQIEKEMINREKTMNEGRNAGLKKWDFPEYGTGEYKKLPVIGEVFTMGYVNKVFDWCSGFVGKLIKLIADNEAKKKELDRRLAETEACNGKLNLAIERLEGKHGQKKLLEQYAALRLQGDGNAGTKKR